jgi:hypothetical protein
VSVVGPAFRETDRFRPFALVAPAFTQVAEALGRSGDLSRDASALAAPFLAVELEVRGGSGVVVAGLADASGDHVAVSYDTARRRVGVELRRDGRTRLLRRRTVELPESFTLGFVLCENQVTALARTGGAWRPLLTERGRVAARIDLREALTLRRFGYLWGVRPGSGPVELDAVRAGPFGMAGLRDPHLVQHADGRPYLEDGRAFLTWTCAGLGFFEQGHWGVFSLDLEDPRRLEQVAQLYVERGGLLLGDQAGQLVRDGDRWLVANSSWGDFGTAGVHVRHAVSSADLLSGVHVLRTERTPLPTQAHCWDPGMTRIDGRWHVSFVEGPSVKPFRFHPAVARGPLPGAGEWYDGLVPLGAATGLSQCEGPVLTRLGDAWRVLASDKHTRSFPVFDLGMAQAGRLRAPYPTNIPHPQLVPLPDGGHLLVTFDGTRFGREVLGYGTHGDVVVMRAEA